MPAHTGGCAYNTSEESCSWQSIPNAGKIPDHSLKSILHSPFCTIRSTKIMFLTTIATGWEIGCFRAQMQLAQKNLAEANRIVGANITVGAMLLDQEQLGVGYGWNSSTRQVNTFLACVAETARPLPDGVPLAGLRLSHPRRCSSTRSGAKALA